MSRSRILTIAVAPALAVVMGACAPKQTPVRIVGEPLEMSALVGEWRGEYSSRETGRSGSIVFRLKSVTDTAYGDVIMISRKSVQQQTGADPAMRSGVTPAPGQVLTIRFVRMEGGRVVGRMAPYTDPDCDCRTLTTFHGTFKGPATIEGTFESSRSNADQAASMGKWKVNRITQ